MDSSQVRERILAEHAELREGLAQIETLADAFRDEAADVGGQLRERGLALYARFARHLAFEEEVLVPALLGGGLAGEQRAARLDREHREQRELLHYLVGRLRDQDRPTLLMARELRNFVEYLRQDMAHEEETLLSAEALGAGARS